MNQIPTYSCAGCGYVQDFEGATCPACSSPLALETEPSRMVTVHIATDEEFASREVLDASGELVETGEQQRIEIVDGKPTVVTEPVFSVVKRAISQEELAALKQQRDGDLDRFEAVSL